MSARAPLGETVVIYHAYCTDGFVAAWVLWKKFGRKATYVPAEYGDDPPYVFGKDVYVVDFSYPRETLLQMHREARSLVVYDHHKTAEEALEGLGFATFDQQRSGAGLTWDLTFPDTPRPFVIDYVEDRDLWAWSLPRSRKINATLGLIPCDFEAWDELQSVDVETLADRGMAVLVANEASQEAALDAGTIIYPDFLGFVHVPVVNMSPRHISGALNRLLLRDSCHPFAVGWFQMHDGRFKYSLRSTDERKDVSAIAKLYGGGGHRNAAGFVLDLPPWDLQWS